jgi:hypothetical protein
MRYGPAIDGTPDLRLRAEWKEIKPHLDTLQTVGFYNNDIDTIYMLTFRSNRNIVPSSMLFAFSLMS